MSTLARASARLREENGGVLLFVAIGLPTLLAVFAIALDVGNWFLHKRALQNQVDAAAFAGGAFFADCFIGDGSGAFTAMKNEAYKYDGKNGLYNPQVGGTLKGTLTVLYNSQTYATGQVDPILTPADPCTAPDYVFDVKGSDADIPLILAGLLPGVPNLSQILARARVQLRKEQISAQSLPLAVPNVNPKTVTATFVDQATGAALAGCAGGCVFPLAKGGPSGTLQMWSGQATIPTPLVPGTKVGVRIGLATAGQGCANTSGGTGFVCYDNEDNKLGLAALRVGSSLPGSPLAPTLKGAWPTTVCSGSPFFSDVSLGGGATCGAGVQATVDFGTGVIDPTLSALLGGVGAKVFAAVNGSAPQELTYSGGVWSTSGTAFGLPPDLGPLDIELEWEEHSGTVDDKDCTKTPLPGPCKGSWGNSVNAFHSGFDVTSGPVKTLAVTEPAASNPGAPYSLAPSGSHVLTVTVGLEGSLQLSPGTRLLRLTGGSRTSAIQCDGTGASEFRDAVAYGCQTPYQLNATGLCPDPSPPAGPADCVPLETGTMTGPTEQGLDIRFASCPANNWPNYDPLTDKRIVQLMVTDFSYLGGAGGTEVPVVDFGEFYITGWSGSSCATNQAWPFAPLIERRGDIWGHFIKYTPTTPGVGGVQPCDPTAITPCVPVLTR